MYIIWQVFLPYFIVTFFKYTPELQESYRECPYAHCLDSVRYVLLHLLLPISILPTHPSTHPQDTCKPPSSPYRHFSLLVLINI